MTRDLAAEGRAVVDANRYLTLGTADADGTPWTTPVYFSPDGYRDFYWVSSPTARHSTNIAGRPLVSIVVFDSQAPIGRAEAVYMRATARLVAEGDLEHGAEIFGARDRLEGYGADELRADATLRLYCATVVAHSMLIRGSDPLHESEVDTRVPVDLTSHM